MKHQVEFKGFEPTDSLRGLIERRVADGSVRLEQGGRRAAGDMAEPSAAVSICITSRLLVVVGS